MFLDSVLSESFRDLADARDDFQQSQYQNSHNVLRRFVVAFDAEPLAGFLRAVLPTLDVDSWLANAWTTKTSMVGTGALDWPSDRAERVALQVGLVRRLAGNDRELLNFAHEFCNAGYNQISAHFQEFGNVILAPMLRDLERLAETRAVPPILFSAMGSLPPSGDLTLDGLLNDAVAKFRDPAPKARNEAVERLWDAWERLKTLDVSGDKRMSVMILLDRAAPDAAFRALLESEAQALTSIGNSFHIRHFETDRSALAEPRYADYLFHRLFALVHLLVFARVDDAG